MSKDQELEEIDDEQQQDDEQPPVGEGTGEGADEGADKDADADKDKVKPDPELARLRRELKSEQSRRKEAESSTRYWYEEAAKGGKGPSREPATPPEPEEVKVSVDLVEAITNNDAKALAKALEELGFAKKTEVTRELHSTIGKTRAQIVEETTLIGEYPDLNDEDSELFRATQANYNRLAKDPTMAKSPTLLKVATELTAAQLGIEPANRRSRVKGAQGTRRAADDNDQNTGDDPDLDEEEQERQARVRAQQGPRGRGRAATAPEDDELSPQQKSLIARFRAAGANITEDGYRKRAKAGIKLAGLPTRRGRG